MKLSELFPLQFCINLDERTDRWESVTKEFAKLDITPKRFSAIGNIQNPALGCYQSHLTLLRKARELQQNILIFEDDILLINDYQNIIESALDELVKLDWQMIYFGGNILKPFYQMTDHLGKLTHCQSTHSYAINSDFLDELVPFIEKQAFYIDMLYSDVCPQRNCFITLPMVMLQKVGYSDIEHQEVNYDYTLDRFNQNLIRMEK